MSAFRLFSTAFLFLVTVGLLGCQNVTPVSTPEISVRATDPAPQQPEALPTATAYPAAPTLTPVPSPTAYPTATPHLDQPTYTPEPSLTPAPTSTPYAEATEYPPFPTYTPLPTPTKYPTATPYARSPTNTPRPTHTPFPTSTPYPTPRVPAHRIAFVGGMKDHRTAFWEDRRQALLVGCRTNAPVGRGRTGKTYLVHLLV